MNLKPLLITVLVFSVITVRAQDVDEILANYFENTGGIENWNKFQASKVTGKFPTPQGDFPFVVYSKRPNKVKIEVDIQGTKIVMQAYDGVDAWSFNPLAGGTSAQKMTEEQTKLMDDQAEFEPLYLNYKEKGHEISLDSTEEIDGVECFKLVVVRNKNNDKDESTEYHFFDTENFVPIMVRQTIQTGPAKGQQTEMYFSEYQETDANLILPYYIEQRVDGHVAMQLVYESIESNPELDDAIFEFPKSSETDKEDK